MNQMSTESRAEALPALSPEAWALLHEVRLRGMLQTPAEDPTAQLETNGLAARKGEFLVLTGEGRDAHMRWALLDEGTEEHEVARRAYEGFLPLNQELLKICHDWQVLPGGALNDHRDPKYDWDVIDRIEALDERAGPIVRRLGRAVDRFGEYRSRLRSARRQLADGEHEWLASPRCDSYHTVWMQLHEDLLAALGIKREDEPGHSAAG